MRTLRDVYRADSYFLRRPEQRSMEIESNVAYTTDVVPLPLPASVSSSAPSPCGRAVVIRLTGARRALHDKPDAVAKLYTDFWAGIGMLRQLFIEGPSSYRYSCMPKTSRDAARQSDAVYYYLGATLQEVLCLSSDLKARLYLPTRLLGAPLDLLVIRQACGWQECDAAHLARFVYAYTTIFTTVSVARAFLQTSYREQQRVPHRVVVTNLASDGAILDYFSLLSELASQGDNCTIREATFDIGGNHISADRRAALCRLVWHYAAKSCDTLCRCRVNISMEQEEYYEIAPTLHNKLTRSFTGCFIQNREFEQLYPPPPFCFHAQACETSVSDEQLSLSDDEVQFLPETEDLSAASTEAETPGDSTSST